MTRMAHRKTPTKVAVVSQVNQSINEVNEALARIDDYSQHYWIPETVLPSVVFARRSLNTALKHLETAADVAEHLAQEEAKAEAGY